MHDITPEILNTFLRLSGYDASIFEDIKFKGNEPKVTHEYNIIEFHNLEEAQKAEKELREMFYCYIVREAEFDKTGMTKARLLNLTSFKESGKYYDNFDVEISSDIDFEHDFNIVKAILDKYEKLPEHFMYHGHYANNVPFIIPAHMKASDMKPYVKIGESK